MQDEAYPLSILDYPSAITLAALQAFDLRQSESVLLRQVSDLELEADKTVFFDETLKNDGQRRVSRLVLLQTEEYVFLLSQVAIASRSRLEADLAVEQLRREFSVAKLHLRLEAGKGYLDE